MKQKRGDTRRKRQVFVLLALVAFMLAGISLALSIDIAAKIMRGERYYAGESSAFIIIAVCLFMIVFLRWSTLRTYHYLWHDAEKSKRD